MSDFAEFVQDVFRDFGAVRCRKMFGGYGVYFQGTMFALIAEDILYLKADDSTADSFRAKDLPPFQYTRNGRVYQMSYFQAPEEIFDDPSAAAAAAKLAYEAALRSAALKAAKKSKSRKKPPAS
jgi:DNA transformation protein and related proteins